MKKFILILLLVSSISFLQAQDYANAQLENSPRHHEWVEVEYEERTVHCFVAFPEKAEKTMTVIVIHENRGLTDWVRSFTDQMAAEGYIAIAPDLLSGFSKKYQQTSDFPTSDEARKAIYKLDQEQVKNDLNAVQAYAAKMEAANGATTAVGFCWGGSQSFRFATHNNKLGGALVFYGTAPKDTNAFKRIDIPVYGFYGGNDERVNSTISRTDSLMQANGKAYETAVYDGAGHAYMRRGDDPEAAADDANKTARDQSWERIRWVLKDIADIHMRNREDDE